MMKLTFGDSLEFAAKYALRTGRTDPDVLIKALRRYENKWETDPLTIAPLELRYAGLYMPRALRALQEAA